MTIADNNPTEAGLRRGRVLRSHSNLFFVQTGGREWPCRQRGRFRLERNAVLTGDWVLFEPQPDGNGYIVEIEKRHNELIRPPIANVDQAVIVFTAREPDLNLPLLDRFLVLAAWSDIGVVLCLNKADLITSEEAEAIAEPYRQVGYTVLPIAAKHGTGLDKVTSLLTGRVSVLAGQSGVGKSRLVNALAPGLSLRTGEVSQKLGRGRHTTRHVELLPVAGGLLADTPGFSLLDVTGIPKDQLWLCFPEFVNYGNRCRFATCLHHKEPDCAVKAAVEEGHIQEARYRRYIEFLEEILAAPVRYH